MNSLDKKIREAKPQAILKLEESTGRVSFCGLDLGIPNRSQQKKSKLYVLLKALCVAAIENKSPWLDYEALMQILWPSRIEIINQKLMLAKNKVIATLDKLPDITQEEAINIKNCILDIQNVLETFVNFDVGSEKQLNNYINDLQKKFFALEGCKGWPFSRLDGSIILQEGKNVSLNLSPDEIDIAWIFAPS